ncbi:MAG: Sir2 family NAD+-dependent deacetylase [Pseudomonadota bacterium]
MNRSDPQPVDRRPAPRSVVILTGAGISAESGIGTFRGSNGLWENHRIEDVATPEGFLRDPDRVHLFYNQRRRQLLDHAIRPNPAHTALARLERDYPGEVLLVTQNIDNLHERAGSRRLLHMHGELLRMRCQISDRVFDIREDLGPMTACQCCRQAGNLRPHIVWFGEMPFHMPEITRALEDCDLFVAIGTSGHVYPAAGFHEMARSRRAHTVEINLEATGSQFDEHIRGRASETVPRYVDRLLALAGSGNRAESFSGK